MTYLLPLNSDNFSLFRALIFFRLAEWLRVEDWKASRVLIRAVRAWEHSTPVLVARASTGHCTKQKITNPREV